MTKIYSTEKQIPAINYLKLAKSIFYGGVEAHLFMNEEFLLMDQFIGVAFKVNGPQNFLAFEVGKDICRIRRYTPNLNPEENFPITEDIITGNCTIEVNIFIRIYKV